MTLKTYLEHCPVVELRAMARSYGIRLQSLLKGDVISQLERGILEAVEQKRRLAELPDACQSALGALLDAAGSLPLPVIAARFGALRRGMPGAVEKAQPWADGHSTPLDILHVWGLAFRVTDPVDGEMVIIPSDVVERLRPAEVARPRVFRTCAAPSVSGGVCTRLSADLMLLASAVVSAPAALVAGGRLARRDLLRLNAHLLSPDEITDVRTDRCARRFTFLRDLGECLGLLQSVDGRLESGPALDHWLSVSPHDRMAAVINACLDRSNWAGLDDIPTLQIISSPDRSGVPAARRFLFQLMSEADPGEWYSIASLIQAARTRNSLLLRRPGDGSQIRDAQTGRDLTPRDWALVEGAWIEALLRGPFSWLGLVEMGRTRKGEVTSFRIPTEAMSLFHDEMPSSLTRGIESGSTETGIQSDPTLMRKASGQIRSEEESPDSDRVDLSAVVVADDLVVHVGAESDMARWFRLERLCELHQRGPVSRYRISREKVRQALQNGFSHDQILLDLGPGVPAAVDMTIRGWSNRFGQVRIFQASVITAAEAALMNEMKAVPEIAACLDRPLGSRAWVVDDGKGTDLIALLRARGEMPHVEMKEDSETLLGAPTLAPEVWCDIRKALLFWKEAAAAQGLAGPCEATLQAVSALLRMVQREERPEEPQEGASSLSLLEEAINHHHTIAFDYYESDRPTTERHVLTPRKIGQNCGVNYVSGYRKGGARMDSFRVDRMHNLCLA